MPAEEARVVEVLGVGNVRLVELAVVRVAELDVLEAFVLLDEAVADDLDLGLVRNSLEIGVQDGSLGV